MSTPVIFLAAMFYYSPFLTWIVVGSLPRADHPGQYEGHCQGTSGKSKVIQPLETGVVTAIRVSDGEAVKAGDILVEIDPTEDAADETRLTYNLARTGST